MKNFGDRRTLRIGAVVCSAGIVIGGGITLASSARGAGSVIGLNAGAGAVPVVANLGTGNDDAANAAYAARISEASLSNLRVGLESAPTGGSLSYEVTNGNAAATSSAFQVVNGGVREIQTAVVSATGGTFTLSWQGGTTSAIAFNASPGAVQTALNLTASIIAGGSVTVTGSPGNYAIRWNYPYDANPITSTPAGLTPGGSTVTMTTTLQGEAYANGGVGSASLGTVANTDLVYLTGDQPGDYKVRLYQDINGNGAFDAVDERSSELFTLKVYDAVNATAGITGDDVAPVFAAAGPLDVGQAVKATVTYNQPLSLSDARGTGVTGLQSRLADLTAVDATSTAAGIASATNTHATYTPSTATTSFTTTASTGAGLVTLRGDLKPALGDPDGSLTSMYGTRAVTVAGNGVATVANSVTAGADHLAAAGTTSIRAGLATTTFTTVALDGGGTPAPLAGRRVIFTLTPGAGTPVLSVGGTAVASGGQVTAVTDADGKASITVSSSITTAGTGYTVSANSNNVAPSVVTASYVATTGIVAIDPTLSSTIGGSVTVRGSLKDQFGQKLTPTGGAQAVLNVDRSAPFSGPAADYTQTVGITDGAFSATLPDVAANTAARTDGYTWTFTGPSFSVTSPLGTVGWLTSVVPGSVVVNSLTTQSSTDVPGPLLSTFPAATGTKVDLLNVDLPVISTNSNSEHLAALIRNAAGDPLPGVDFTVSATGGGVYFLDQDGRAVSSYSGKTNSAGLIYDSSVRPYVQTIFTLPGTHTLTITAGGKTASTGDFIVEDATVPYSINLAATVGLTGKNVLIKGKVLDAFGNGVVGITPNVTLSTNTLGSILGALAPSDAAGNFSRLLLSGDSTGKADVKVDASGPGGITPVAAHAYGTTGLTLPAGVAVAEAPLQILTGGLTIQGAVRRVGPGAVPLNGVSAPGSPVDIYVLPKTSTGDYTRIKTITADTNGAWNTLIDIKGAVSLKAVSGGKESSPITVAMTTKVQANPIPDGGGEVRIAVAGYPGAAGSGVALYEVTDGGLEKIGETLRGDSRGVIHTVWTTTPGTKTVKAIAQAPGTNQGSVLMSFAVS